jgi:DNA-binding MarR family transcriptional regulator
MEQRGLVKREDCAEDARATTIRLTDEGCEAVIAANCERIRAIRAHLVDLLAPRSSTP